MKIARLIFSVAVEMFVGNCYLKSYHYRFRKYAFWIKKITFSVTMVLFFLPLGVGVGAKPWSSYSSLAGARSSLPVPPWWLHLCTPVHDRQGPIAALSRRALTQKRSAPISLRLQWRLNIGFAIPWKLNLRTGTLPRTWFSNIIGPSGPYDLIFLEISKSIRTGDFFPIRHYQFTWYWYTNFSSLPSAERSFQKKTRDSKRTSRNLPRNSPRNG